MVSLPDFLPRVKNLPQVQRYSDKRSRSNLKACNHHDIEFKPIRAGKDSKICTQRVKNQPSGEAREGSKIIHFVDAESLQTDHGREEGRNGWGEMEGG